MHSLVPGGGKEKVSEGSTSLLTGARIVTTMFVNDEPQTVIELLEVRRWDMQEREGAGGGRAASWKPCSVTCDAMAKGGAAGQAHKCRAMGVS